ncbi:hypothetical protein GQ53DRAFT_698977 [Thozetella sp. PMI_491]|nr:hypothetical protein GQ53DRAFT_698977 [Thozetella sp. PMI_491]
MSVMASWTNYLVTIGTFVYAGGPVGFLYGTLIVGAFQQITAFSLAELSSIWPHSGGAQYWVSQMAPKESAAPLSYFLGWMNILGYITSLGSCNISVTQTLTALVTNITGYEWPRYQMLLLYWALCILNIPVNVWPKYYTAFNFASVFWLISCLFVTIGVWSANHSFQSADFVFTTFVNQSGWRSDGFVFILSMVQTTFAMTAMDSVLHLSQETKKPKRTIPRALVLSIALSILFCFGFAIFILYSLSDLDSLVGSSLGQIYLQLYVNSIGFEAGLGVGTMIMVPLGVFVGTQIMTTSSRLIWAMAVQRGVPFSSYFCVVDSKTEIPLRAFWASFAVSCAMGFLYLAGDSTWNAIASSVVASIQLTYVAPISVLPYRGRDILPPCSFSLDRFLGLGLVANWITVLWGIFIVIASFFLVFLLVTGDSMNYSIIVFAIWAIVVIPYWFVSARKNFFVDSVGSEFVDEEPVPCGTDVASSRAPH